MPTTLAQLAEITGARLRGPGDIEINQVAAPETALHGEITFITSQRYLQQLAHSSASAVILNQADSTSTHLPALIHDSPYWVYAKVAQQLNPRVAPYQGIHETAWVHPNAELGDAVVLGPYVSVGAGAKVGAGSVLAAGVVIENGAVIGQRCWFGANAVVSVDCQLGDDVILQPGAIIGGDGFGYARGESGEWTKIPQLGKVIIGNRVEVGANTTIDRGTIEDTVIADGVILDNQIQIAHNVKIGAHTAIAGATAIAGSTVIGEHCTIGGAVIIVGHIEIVSGTHIAANTLVSHSIKQAGAYASSTPIDMVEKWRKNSARFRQLDHFVRRLHKLEKQLSEEVK